MPSVVAVTNPSSSASNATATAAAACPASSSRRPRRNKHFWGAVTREGEVPMPPASRVPPLYRRNVFLRDGYRCQYCGRRFPYRLLSLDHVCVCVCVCVD